MSVKSNEIFIEVTNLLLDEKQSKSLETFRLTFVRIFGLLK